MPRENATMHGKIRIFNSQRSIGSARKAQAVFSWRYTVKAAEHRRKMTSVFISDGAPYLSDRIRGVLQKLARTRKAETNKIFVRRISRPRFHDADYLILRKIKPTAQLVKINMLSVMLGYVKKSKDTAANSTARSLYNAANAALTEMDEEGSDLSGYFIICSDKLNFHNILLTARLYNKDRV